MTESEVYWNYNQAISKANELNDIARELDNLMNRNMTDAMNMLSSAWKGQAASMYLNKGSSLKTQIKATANSLRNTASTIRQMAENIKNTELRNIEIARQREYNLRHGGGGGSR